ncbi:PLAT/LH2 domain-containing protein [Blastopirellula marina]|uniref:PLAT/LH2 domain-containing protein n=1 Tax=Blastopirellula marina TaxID=124 RepID=UPI0002D8DF73|nr:PLAT/LH2 domain-containing protein [Blastopirellula marina]
MKRILPTFLLFAAISGLSSVTAAEPVDINRVSYVIHTQTKPERDAGTGHIVELTMYGTNGSTEVLKLNNPDIDDFAEGGAYTDFKFKAAQTRVGDVGRVLKIDIKLDGDGDDDWHYGTWSIERMVDGKPAPGGYSIFSYDGWLGNETDRGWKVDATLVIDELRSAQIKHGKKETIVLRNDWVMFNNLGASKDERTQTVSLTLNQGMWSSKTRELSQNNELTLGWGTKVLGVKYTGELKTSLGIHNTDAEGEDMSFSKTGSEEIKMTIPDDTLVLRRVQWVVDGKKVSLGSFSQWVPEPASLRTESSEKIEFTQDKTTNGLIDRQKRPISDHHMKLIKILNPSFRAPGT